MIRHSNEPNTITYSVLVLVAYYRTVIGNAAFKLRNGRELTCKRRGCAVSLPPVDPPSHKFIWALRYTATHQRRCVFDVRAALQIDFCTRQSDTSEIALRKSLRGGKLMKSKSFDNLLIRIPAVYEETGSRG
jgi:hypothetical protein